MVMCEYFSASDDDAAIDVLDQFGGPNTSHFDVVALKGVDPVVVMAQLEAILTNCTYDEVSQRPRVGQLLSSPDSESAFIMSVSDTVQEALASATPDALVEAAGPWSETDELQASGVDAERAVEALVLLSALAGRARSTGHRLYCWWAV
ncbi:hypothetical protein [Streptomyces sp. NBC_00690]|uniref:hypothetical protein n=1 Tax=Streptomyces sp. NBC_00690 TaxID=2975808 RepID=UPI002E2B3388|nr:hypothetical protein [Streptomyces sp. NBC_00690]